MMAIQAKVEEDVRVQMVDLLLSQVTTANGASKRDASFSFFQGASVNADNHLTTALHYAAAIGPVAVVRSLLDKVLLNISSTRI